MPRLEITGELRSSVIEQLSACYWITVNEVDDRIPGKRHRDDVGTILRALSRSGMCERRRRGNTGDEHTGRPWEYRLIDDEYDTE